MINKLKVSDNFLHILRNK